MLYIGLDVKEDRILLFDINVKGKEGESTLDKKVELIFFLAPFKIHPLSSPSKAIFVDIKHFL